MMMKTRYVADYPNFLEHVVTVADRFRISLSESAQRILKHEYPIFIQAMEVGGKTIVDIENDMKQTFIYKSNEKFYKANGIDRNWLGHTIE